jgi:hypothetical protein
MADSYATLDAEKVRLHGKRIVARVVEIDGVLKLQVKDSRLTNERQSGAQASTWLTFDTAAASHAVFT